MLADHHHLNWRKAEKGSGADWDIRGPAGESAEMKALREKMVERAKVMTAIEQYEARHGGFANEFSEYFK